MGRLELPSLATYASETYAYTSSATCPCPRQESDLHNRLRSPVFYPLNYGGDHFSTLTYIAFIAKGQQNDRHRIRISFLQRHVS